MLEFASLTTFLSAMNAAAITGNFNFAVDLNEYFREVFPPKALLR